MGKATGNFLGCGTGVGMTIMLVLWNECRSAFSMFCETI